MTYEEWKNNKEDKGVKKNKVIKSIVSKLFTIVIFVMLVMILSNYSIKFRDFINEEVLNSTFDFSFVNKILNKTTDVFKNDKTVNVMKEKNDHEEYKDGIKYFVNEEYEVKCKEAGIVTYIGEKEGYNNTIVIQQSNGYYAWYGNVKESVKLYDYIERGNTIGKTNNEYYYVLLKDNKPVLLDEN